MRYLRCVAEGLAENEEARLGLAVGERRWSEDADSSSEKDV